MIYTAYELLAKLRILKLVGQNFDKELEWVGTTEQWDKISIEEESILRDNQIKHENNLN